MALKQGRTKCFIAFMIYFEHKCVLPEAPFVIPVLDTLYTAHHYVFLANWRNVTTIYQLSLVNLSYHSWLTRYFSSLICVEL